MMKTAFIGCGGFGAGVHLPNVAANKHFELVALCDLDQVRLEALEQKYHPHYVTTDMNRIFTDESIEMIVCATKPDFRLPIMRRAVEHGKHLFVEKPLCMREEDIEPMVRLMRAASIKFMVGFNRPYSPMMQDIKRIFRQCKACHTAGSASIGTGSTTIIYRIVGEAQLWPKHHFDAVIHDKESTIIHEATHIFDLLNWLTDSWPTKVYTEGEGNTDNIITLTYPDQTTAVIIAGDNSCAGYPKERIEINTNYETIIGENFTECSHFTAEGEVFHKTYDYTIGGEKQNDEFRQTVINGCRWRQSITPEEIEIGYYYNRMPKVNKGHAEELDFFRRAIESDTTVETDVVSGAAASYIAWRAIESWEKGIPIEMKLENLLKLYTSHQKELII